MPAADSGVTERTRASRAQRVALAAIVAFALLIRIGYVALVPVPKLKYDPLGYDMTARRLLAEGYYGYGSSGVMSERPNAVAMPGYSLFLAAVYRADTIVHPGNHGIGAARAAQALLGTAVVLLVYLLGARLAGPSAGLAGALLAAAYPPAVVAVGALWTETLFTFLMMSAMLATLWAIERPSAVRFALAGAALALAVYVRPPALLWAPFAVAYAVWALGWKRAAKYAAVAAAALCLALVPWWARNAAIYGRFVPFNTLTARPLLETSVPLERTGPVANEVTWPKTLLADETALNAYWLRTSLRNDAAWWRRDTRDFLAVHVERAARQVRMVWLPTPGKPPALLVAVSRTWHWLLLVLGVGALLVLPHDRRLWLLASVPVTTFLLYAATFPDRRYMFPNTPVLAVFAGISLVALAERVTAEVRGSERANDFGGAGASPTP